MKRLLSLIIFICFLAPAYAGGGDADTLGYIGSDFRAYLKSIQKGLTNDIAWDSPANISVTTSVIATSTYSYSVKLEDNDGNLLRFFSDSVANFTVSTARGGAATQASSATVVSGTLNFDGGSATGSLWLTGPWSVGNYITVSFPALAVGGMTSTTGSLIITFTQ